MKINNILKERVLINMDVLLQLKIANQKRQKDWAEKKANIEDWDLPRWGNAVAGETGEMCNIIKKIDRGDFSLEEAKKTEVLADEIADIIIYLDLLSQKAGIDIGAAIVNKFNKKSDDIGSDIKIYYY